MSQDQTDAIDEDIDPGDKRVSMKRSNIDRLEAKAERADAAERQLAFLKAGINPEDERQQYFFNGYKGEIDASAIKQAAIAAGFLSEPDTGAATRSAGEAAERVASAAAGQSPTPSQAGNADHTEEYAEAYAKGGSKGLAAAAAKYGPVVGVNT